ncbi:MAG: hypothetical protein GX458_07580 [Phyllobacteriaceae bacterium]|nr:hypothetical protein [Phyllobacteriaceae bacterium]
MKLLRDFRVFFLAVRGYTASLLAVFVVAGGLQFVLLARLSPVFAVIGHEPLRRLIDADVGTSTPAATRSSAPASNDAAAATVTSSTSTQPA